MIRTVLPRRLLAPGLLAALAAPVQAADLVALSPQTWDRYIPAGQGSRRHLRRLCPDERPACRGRRAPRTGAQR